MKTFHTTNPYSQQILKKYYYDKWDDIEQKIDFAQNAFEAWRLFTVRERCKPILKVAEILRSNIEDYAQMITAEMGKPLSEAKGEIEKCAWLCDYYAEIAPENLAPTPVEGIHDEVYVRYMPTGIILGIMPWNFPFWQVIRFALPALLSGNTCLVKHAPNTSGCSLLIERIFAEAGLPAGVFQALIADHEDIPKVIAHAAIQGVSLTGSEKAGSIVASLAGKNIKKSVLELGGSDPFIVMADADIRKAVKMALVGRIMNNGQSCIAPKRFIIHEDIYDAFKNEMLLQLEKIKIGNPESSTSRITCLARPDLADKVEAQIQKSIREGAIRLAGGERNGNQITPCVLELNESNNTAFKEEIFGPVFPLIRFSNNEMALSIANDTAYGLGASVWSTNPENAMEIAAHLQAGSVFVNQIVKSDPRLPFGGTKLSGYGRELAQEGLHEFCNIQTLSITY